MSSLILNRPWSFRNPKDSLVEELCKSLGFPRSITAFLVNRGLDTKQKIEEHLHVSLSSLTDPFVMKSMDVAANRLALAIGQRETIGIFGDFDADGVCASALMHLFLRELGAESHVYIPHREKEGYGLNKTGLDKLSSKGCSLVVTVDCGITNMEEARYCSGLGMELIITDHHKPSSEIPLAVACLDPQRKDCAFPFKGLAGVGVAFFLIWATRRRLIEKGFFNTTSPPNLRKYLDLVAIGTVADMMPLYRENRILVKEGLEVMASGQRPSVKALMDSCGLGNIRLSCRDIAFRLGPRLNAAGRMDHADTAFSLLTSEDYREALGLSKRLEDLNQDRQRYERKLLSQVLEFMAKDGSGSSLVFHCKGWKKGILGLVASKVVEQANRPVILLTEEDGMLIGSGRAPEEIDLFGAISSCCELLTRFGGHRSAAGLAMAMENLHEFKQRFQQAVMKQKADHKQRPRLELDAQVELSELVSSDYASLLEMLEPFGPMYESPLFAASKFQVTDARVVGQNHLKIAISPHESSSSTCQLDLLAWGQGNKLDLSWQELELAFTPSVNIWNGRKSVQLILKDARRP